MQRKDFIKLTSLGLLSIPFLSFENHKTTGKSKKVILIGAGMAGAAAARTLQDAGCEVVVLEARDRTGGRVHTHTDWGTNIELGANWIHNAHLPENPLLNYAKKLNIKMHSTSYSNLKVYDAHGDKISKLTLGLFYLWFEKKLNKNVSLINNSSSDISLKEVLDTILKDPHFSAKEKRIASLIEESYSNNLAVNLQDASAKYYLNTSVRKEENDLFVLGGYNKIIQDVMQGIDIKLNHIVREVRHKRDGVEVITDQQTFAADYVMITVPISILQKGQIAFSAALPDWKMNAFSKMKMGIFNKVVMEFTEKFWEGDADFQCYPTDLGNAFGIALNYHHYTDKPILIAMPVDKAGLWVENNDIEVIQKSWQQILHQAHPGKTIEFKNIMTTKWNADKFSQGSYTHVPVGATTADFEALQKEVGRIHFAGEATDIAHHGTVHGAYISGVREANKILNN